MVYTNIQIYYQPIDLYFAEGGRATGKRRGMTTKDQAGMYIQRSRFIINLLIYIFGAERRRKATGKYRYLDLLSTY